MKYRETIGLKDGRSCILRNGTAADGQAMLDIYVLTHVQTDYLLSYPDEVTMTALQEAQFLREKTDSENEIEIFAEFDGKIVGSAGINQKSPMIKLRHRCEFGISIDKNYWGLGIGRALTEACIECAQKAGYEQMELEVVAENERAVRMYEKCGFTEYGRNPRDFKSRLSGYQEVIYMRKELI